MTLYRFASKAYSNSLDGEGARLKGGRWNSRGVPVVYSSTTISLSLLELFIHSASYDEISSNILVRIHIPDSLSHPPAVLKLKNGWQHDTGYTQFIGTEFLISRSSLLLQVPSAIIPEENNVLINPLHPDMKKVKITAAAPFHFDSRLFK